MEKRFQAVYKGGALLPEGPLHLAEMQRVTVTITEPTSLDDNLTGYFTPEQWAAAANDPVTWGDVRQALSDISGSVSNMVTAQHQER
ncbi:MAG: antitoxin family protein [Candidatus Dormibacteraceae bacterium]